MADEFIKGLGILTFAGMIWFSIASWWNTPSFEGEQLFGPNPDPADLTVYGELLIFLKDAMFWLAVIGAITFWVIIPTLRATRAYLDDRRVSN